MFNKLERFSSAKVSFLLFLFFLSGFATLVYEVLWLSQLRQLFGSAVYATATTLTVFFLGLALGGYLWGKRADHIKNPLRAYALLELGIGLTALLYFLILKVYYAIYPLIFIMIGQTPFSVTVVKFVLALVLLLPPAWFMGGTLPLMGKLLVQRKEQLSRTTSLLYAVNTLGATFGALAAGFYLPVLLGFQTSYILAITLNGIIAITAFSLSYLWRQSIDGEVVPDVGSRKEVLLPKGVFPKRIALFIFSSGFITLGLEVLWTQMFAQVVVNDVYSFAAILTIFLAALALGGFLSHFLCRWSRKPWTTLYVLMILSGILVGLSPFIFYRWTDGLNLLTVHGGWGRYSLAIFGMAVGIILAPGIILGSIFPFLLRLVMKAQRTTGETLGLWISINTVGAIFGSLGAGFILVKYLGLWGSIGFMAAIYFVLSVMIMEHYDNMKVLQRSIIAFGLVIVLSIVIPAKVSSVRLNTNNEEQVQEIFTGSNGIVAVIRSHPPHYPEGYDDLFIRQNNHHTLGGLGSLANEQRQAHLPLFIHPNPESVFFLGLGTGITAGAALYHPIERMVVTEIVPEVVTAAEKYFGSYNNGLFEDKRARIIVEDGRNYLLGTSEKYDVIIGDLFSSWVPGTGILYTREHFKSVKSRLKEGGIFAQWLPLYQLSEREFGIIVRTFLDVFPQVTLWRGNFVPDKPIVALVGQVTPSPIRPETLVENARRLGRQENANEVLIDALVSVKGLGIFVVNPESKEFLVKLLPKLVEVVPFTFYVGNLTFNQDYFRTYPVNTDDRPLVEFLASKALADQRAGKGTWLTAFELERLLDKLFTSLPPDDDPYLRGLTPAQIGYVKAGLSYYRSMLYEYVGRYTGQKNRLETAHRWFNDYLNKTGLHYPKSD